MLNLSMSTYFSVVLISKGISLAIKEYIVIISNKSIVMIIMCKLSFKVREGRRAANFPKLCVFLYYTAIS